jgi:hypothetical protein
MRNEWDYRNKDELQQAKPKTRIRHNLNKQCLKNAKNETLQERITKKENEIPST